jgi:uncharacterized membrane protein
VLFLKLKTIAVVLGIVLIAVALILGGIQFFRFANIYGSIAYRWYFYAALAVTGVVGIVLAVWGLLKKEAVKESPKQTA